MIENKAMGKDVSGWGSFANMWEGLPWLQGMQVQSLVEELRSHMLQSN